MALTGVRVRGQATMDWEAQDDAFVAKLLVPEGAKDIAVGSPVAVFVEDKVHTHAGHAYTPQYGRLLSSNVGNHMQHLMWLARTCFSLALLANGRHAAKCM
jgi:pyruvate/2-oxoglutarate dehydrogenase complex dihydrolipoamide acyltransferase (E2) component